eukprot:11729091-Alexandrium_andersonii.AAC.1
MDTGRCEQAAGMSDVAQRRRRSWLGLPTVRSWARCPHGHVWAVAHERGPPAAQGSLTTPRRASSM